MQVLLISVFDGKIESIKRICLMDKMRMESLNMTSENINKIETMFPNG